MVSGIVPLILGQGGKMLMLLNQSEERADLGAKTRKLSSGGVQGMVPEGQHAEDGLQVSAVIFRQTLKTNPLHRCDKWTWPG